MLNRRESLALQYALRALKEKEGNTFDDAEAQRLVRAIEGIKSVQDKHTRTIQLKSILNKCLKVIPNKLKQQVQQLLDIFAEH